MTEPQSNSTLDGDDVETNAPSVDETWRRIATDPLGVSIAGRFAEIVASCGERVAIEADDACWTYAELDRLSGAIAAAVIARTADAEPVALRFGHGAEQIAAILGVLRAGRPYVPLSRSDPTARQRHIVHDAGCRLILCDAAPEDAARGAMSDAVWLRYDEAVAAASGAAALPDVSPFAVSSIMYTSGTTGAPKGVVQTHRNVVHNVARYHWAVGLGAEDRLALVTPANYAASISPIFGALLTGGTLLPFGLDVPDAQAMARWVSDRRVTVFHSVPTVFRALSREADEALRFDDLRVVRMGGDVVYATDLERFRDGPFADGAVLMVSLASTETGMMLYGVFDRTSEATGATLPVTDSPPGVEVRLIDETGGDAAVGEPGEIVVDSSYLSPGYWGEADTSVDPDAQPRVVTYHTGDLARRDGDGGIRFVGRADRRVKVHGNRFELEELEAAMLSMPGVAEAAALVQRREGRGPRVVGVIVPDESERATSDTLWRERLAERAPEYMIPARVVCLRELPKLPHGKIDRAALAEYCDTAMVARSTRDGPTAQFEKRMIGIWEHVLEVSPIGLDDDFDDLGGDSLKGMSILRRVEQTFGVTMPPSALLEATTVRALTERVARLTYGEASRRTPLVTLRETGDDRPVFFVHAIEGTMSWARPIARLLPAGSPLYGFQSPALYGDFTATPGVARLAETYTALARDLAPDRRCALVGYCMGGAIAMEMARALIAEGFAVDAVVAIDTPLKPDVDAGRGGLRHWSHMARDTLRTLRWRGELTCQRLLRRRSGLLYSHDYRRFVQTLHGWAMAGHRPVVPDTRVSVLKAEQVTLKRGRDAQQDFVEALDPPADLVTIPGDHMTCLYPPNRRGVVAILGDLLGMSGSGEDNADTHAHPGA